MFKLESYVTPLILSYVDKYIKNIKPEDSQLSLWSGEAVFNNLDLKLDVLEQELSLPFTFVNGHIHELRINVPWTKLISEPVVITINTIECILKLKTESDASTDSSSSKSSSSQQTSGNSARKQIRKQEYSEMPPGYVQSLISRVINNICIVCNNLILKYVEDDIVLSLNIKSAELFNANDKWERMFIELSHTDPVLRKVVNMQDMTVCLDRRDASGKIQVYQDPLLYRCSTIWRWYSAYDSPHSKQASVTRIHVFCDKLDFSVTDQQLPMLLRLGELCILLLYGEIGCKSVEIEKHGQTEDNGGEISGEQIVSENQEEKDAGWASWAWSFVPELLPLWGDEGLDEFALKTDRTLVQFGLFIDKASCVFKLSEMFQDTSFYSPPKASFQPVANLQLFGIANEITKRGEDFTNVQLGITGIILSGIGNCPCSDGDTDYSEKDCNYFQAGVLPSNSHTYNYCTSSLFDPLAPENCNQRREYTFDREAHINRLTESIMIERFPAFSFDYFYELELPDDWQGSYGDITPLYLERNNFRERSLCRIVLGPSCLEISSDMMHRFLRLFECVNTSEYPPYNSVEIDTSSNIFPLSEEMMDDLEDFTPQRVYHGTLVKPLIHLHVASHPYTKKSLKQKPRKQRKKDYQSKLRDARKTFLNKEESFITVLGVDTVDFHFIKPMYPQKMALIASSTQTPSESLLYYCYSHLTLKVFGFEATLARGEKALHTIFSPCSLAVCKKTLLMPSLWDNHPNMHLEEQWLEMSSVNMQIRHSHLIALIYVYFSWIDPTLVVSNSAVSVLIENILLKDKPMLVLQLQEIESYTAKTFSVISSQASVGKVNIYVHYNDQSVSVLHGPEDTTNIHKASFFSDPLTKHNAQSGGSGSEESCLVIDCCWPRNFVITECSVILNTKLRGVAANIDPAIKLWFSSQAALTAMPLPTMKPISDCHSTAASHTEESFQESLSSSRTATHSNSRTASKSQSLPVTSTSQKNDGSEMLSPEFVEKATSLCNFLKCVKAQVEIETFCILFTTQLWSISDSSIPSSFVPSLSQWKMAYDNDKLLHACVFSLPYLKLQNRNSSNLRSISAKQELLATNSHDDTRTFSWTAQFNNFSIYSLHSNRIIHYILKPTSATATLADNRKQTSSLLPQLGFCVHVDMEPLHFCSSPKQIQLLVDAVKCVLELLESCNINTWMNNLRHSELTSLLPSLDPIPNTCVLPGITPTASNPPEGIDISTGERDISEEATSINEASPKGEEKMKITIWLQWTLPKFSVSLFAKESDEQLARSWLQLEAEEIMLSLDIQETYIKGKAKVSSLNMISFQKRNDDTDWAPGPFCGIVLCSNNKLTHNICIGSFKQLTTSSFPVQTTDLQSRAFLTLTYTQALCRNVKKKLITKYQSQSMVDRKSDQALFTNQQCRHYVSEIDIQVHPFDVVLWMPLFSVISQMISPLAFLLEKDTVPSVSGSKGLTWSINSYQLPLLYVNCNTIRLFLPRISSETNLVTKSKDSDEIYNDNQENICNTSPDVCILHIGSITVIPQADNPLSRIILHKELFHAAQQSRTLAIPGSDIEDRQYQLDICGLAINAVQWKEFIKHSNIGNEEKSTHVLIMGENPALEWNTRLGSKLHSLDEKDIMCIPILSQFDVRATFAPAIIYSPPKQDGMESEDILVCGHSLELSMTTDIDIYLSIQQLVLFRDIFENNLVSFLHSMSESEIWNRKLNKFKQKQKKDIIMDSGIESESSVLHQGVNQIHFLHSAMGLPGVTTSSKKHDSFVPFEILITAGCISLTSFAHDTDKFCISSIKHVTSKRRLRRKHQLTCEVQDDGSIASSQQKRNSTFISGSGGKEDTTSTDSSPYKVFTSKLVKNESIFLNEEEGYDGSQDSSDSEKEVSSKEENKRKPSKLYPFLYVTITQPHTFVSCHPKNQKFEISCFDVQVKGATNNCFVQETETSVIPQPEIFTQPWLETRPGEADLKTGIPPSLYTLTCKDFLHEAAKVNMSLDRPVKCNLSPSKWCQASSFLDSVSKTVFRSTKTNAEDGGNDGNDQQTHIEKYLNSFRNAISHLLSFKISTVQTAVVIELGHKPQELQVALAVESLSGHLERTQEIAQENFNIDIKGLLLKTCFQSHGCPLLGPFSVNMKIILIWKSWHLWAPLPQLLLRLQGDTVFLTFGPKQLENIEALYNVSAKYIQNENGNSMRSESMFSMNKLEEHQRMEWSDDLRKGSFQYIQDSEGAGIEPQPCEIVFCKESTGERGSMTWCYPEPRALRCVTVYPVPLHPSANLPEGEEHIEQVECSLQYWDKLHHCFVNYCNFHLSETHQYNLDLPVISSDVGHMAIVSEMWRIVLYNTEEDSKAEILSSGALSPLVLAACMRVDSCFDPTFISIFSTSINFDLLQVSLYNCFKNTASPTVLHSFTFDGQAPSDQEFAVVSIDGLTLNCKKWHQQLKIDALMNVSGEILEYRNLTMQTLVEPFDIQGQIYVNMEPEKPAMCEVKMTLHPCFIHINQSTIHTLSTTLDAWEQVFHKSAAKAEQVLPNYYIICNNTHQPIYIGQLETDETIMIPSQKMHAYSWRSQKAKQLLHICVESMKWKWCEAFSPDSKATLVQTIKNKEFALTFIIKFVSLSNLQKQIIIDGQLIISNKLNQPLELQMQTVNSALPLREWTGHKITAALYKQSTLPSFTLNRYQIRILRVRLLGVDNPWSENIIITESKTPFCQLVKIPMKVSTQHMSVWCHVLDQQVTQTISKSLVLFAPLFVVRNHLPHPLLAHLDNHCVEVAGQGKEHQLTTTGDATLHRYLSFQMAPGMKKSAPTIALSSTLINEITESASQISFPELCSHSVPHHSFSWPYDNPEINGKVKENPFSLTASSDISNYKSFSCVAKPSELPDIELQVGLSQRWTGSNTVLVDVKPYSLLINKTNIDLYMVESSGQEWKVNRHSVFTPPSMQKEFSLGLYHKSKLYSSNSIQLSNQSASYWTNSEAVLTDLHCEVITIKINEETCLKVFLFLVTSRTEEDIVIVTIEPTMYISNASDIDLHMMTYALTSNTTKEMPSHQHKKPVKLKASPSYCPYPILCWDLPSSLSQVQSKELIHCFEFSHLSLEEIKDSLKSLSSWSCTVSIHSGDQADRRYTFTIPEIKKYCNKPYVMTYHKRNFVSYLIIKVDPCPLLVLHNNTKYTLTYGQGTGPNKEGEVIVEDAKSRNRIHMLPPACSSYYSLPIVTKKFPDYIENLPPIHFAEYVNNEIPKYWSVAVDVMKDEDQFISIVNCGDVRIYKERVGHTRHIFIDPVNRVEITAREIRSRIGVMSESPETLNTTIEDHKNNIEGNKNNDHYNIDTVAQCSYIPVEKTTFYFSFTSKYICFIISDNVHKKYQWDKNYKKNYLNEILRINIDNILAISRPHFKKSYHHVKRLNHLLQEVSICVGKIQIDNQMDHTSTRGYDFPVILVPQTVIPLSEFHQTEMSFQTKWTKAQKASHVVVNLLLGEAREDILHSQLCFESISIAIQPSSLYIEDSFYYKLLELQSSFIPFQLYLKQCNAGSEFQIPHDVLATSAAFSSPIHIHHMHINSLDVLVSLHASIKLYLAIDHSPLTFKPFDKMEVFTTPYKLGHLLTHHFLTGALLRAGWVVGSLDLLGNPAGFARAVGSGMADFFRFPYHGLLNGPWAFITGISHGSAALLQQITSGAIVSVTNLAASVSRNMDLLSMDADHLSRQEELRRQKPQGISMGLLQGLTGFGISLLGSVAGIIEQPIQEIISQQPSLTPSSSVRAATGFVKGMGKGLVGVVAKPIGGAAELVSQAGQGFLEGAGWRRQPSRQHWPVGIISDSDMSKMKFIWKVSSSMPAKEVLLCIEATHINENGKHVPDSLLLTSEMLLILNKDDDMLQQRFSIAEVDCQGTSNKSEVCIVPKQCITNLPEGPENQAKDRIEEYINKTSKYSTINADWGNPPLNSTISYCYYIHPKLRPVMLAMFNSLQRKLLGKGFSM